MTGRRTWPAIAVAVAVVVATGCGSGRGSKGASGPVPSTTKSTFAADKLRADSLLLTTGDLPAGWIKLARIERTSDDANNEKLSLCARAVSRKLDVVDVIGDEFRSGSSRISSSVRVFDTSAHVRAEARALERDRALSCLRSAYTVYAKSLAYDHPGVTVNGVQAKHLTNPTDRNVTVAFRVSLTLTASGESPIVVYVDDFDIGSQRDALSVIVDSQGTPPKASLERTLLSNVDAKLRKAYA